MPEDVGGRPFPDGSEPDDDQDRGGAQDAFATVVFDEDFVRAARIHEPSAVERLLAAAQAGAEAEARARHRPGPADDEGRDDSEWYEGYGGHHSRRAFGHELDPEGDLDDLDDDGYPLRGGPRPYRGSARWHRPVAWLLALVMGIGMVALAFSAVYRGASAGGDDSDRVVPPPATSGSGPSASADFSQPPVPAQPRTH